MRMLRVLFYMLVLLRIEAVLVDRTFLHNAIAKGAVCLDGTLPVYYLDRGSGTGINNWMIHIEGGGWCDNITSCLARKNSKQGSSKDMAKQLAFSGILSSESRFNPDFHNWNRIRVRYCDGASFTRDVETVDPATKLYFRGARIFLAVVEELLEKGMKNAENINNILVPNVSDPNNTWSNCKTDFSDCSRSQLQKISRLEFINALTGIGVPSSRGYYINSCYTHCQTEGKTWFGTHSPILNNKTIADAVGDWFYDRSQFQEIDCPYPCDKTSPN